MWAFNYLVVKSIRFILEAVMEPVRVRNGPGKIHQMWHGRLAEVELDRS